MKEFLINTLEKMVRLLKDDPAEGVKSQNNSRPSIEFKVEAIEVSLQDIIDYANNRLRGIVETDEVVVVDESANPSLLSMIKKEFQFNVDENMNILFIMDVHNKTVTKITGFCVKAIATDLSQEMGKNNHVLRLTK